MVTHITLANDAEPFAVLRHLVGAHHRAILATNALVIEMSHDPCHGVFVISFDGATQQAARFFAMMTRCRHMLNPSKRPRRDRRSYSTPDFVIFQAVHGVASDNTSLASAALV